MHLYVALKLRIHSFLCRFSVLQGWCQFILLPAAYVHARCSVSSPNTGYHCSYESLFYYLFSDTLEYFSCFPAIFLYTVLTSFPVLIAKMALFIFEICVHHNPSHSEEAVILNTAAVPAPNTINCFT